jgi:hypothetical protein
MSRRIIVVAAALAVGAGGVLASGQRTSRDRHIYVSVTDRDGAPVADLRAADFTVREDKATREVLKVEPATDPMQIELLVDDSQAIQFMETDVRKGLTVFVTDALAKHDGTEIALTTFGERSTAVVPFMTTAPPLIRGIDLIFGRPGSGAYFLLAISDACKEFKKKNAARPVIVAFVNENGPEFTTLSSQKITDYIKGAGASLWAVVQQADLSRGVSNEFENRNRSDILDKTTTDSGGRREIILGQSGIGPALKQIAGWLTHEYRVTYSRPESLIPPEHLDVTVTRPGVKVAATTWAGQ